MTEFKFTVSIIAVITIILLLTVVGVSLSSNETKTDWPPMQTKCPELYKLSTFQNEENICKINNTNFAGYGHDISGNDGTNSRYPKIGDNASCVSVDTSHADFTGIDGDCNKYKWAQNCGVSWDGIYDNPSLCDSSSS
jgi:hypothetical protein